MEEETFFSTLLWIHPTVVVVLVSVVLGENFLDDYRVLECDWTKYEGLISFLKLFASLYGVLTFISLVTHILLFFRVRGLEKKKAEGIMVVNYSCDGITITRRGPDLQTSKKLWKHGRTVITPKASCISFIFNVLGRMLCFLLLFKFGITFQHIATMALCHHFFLCNLVEAIFSPKLSQHLLCYQNRFLVLNV